MGAHPRGTFMSVRTLHAETSNTLRIAGSEGAAIQSVLVPLEELRSFLSGELLAPQSNKAI